MIVICITETKEWVRYTGDPINIAAKSVGGMNKVFNFVPGTLFQVEEDLWLPEHQTSFKVDERTIRFLKIHSERIKS